MRSMRAVAYFVFCLYLAAPLFAQKDKPEPLTEAQIDQMTVENPRAIFTRP